MFLFPVSLIDQSQWTWRELATWNVPSCRLTLIQLMNVKNKSNACYIYIYIYTGLINFLNLKLSTEIHLFHF